jgi:hypothetical protein
MRHSVISVLAACHEQGLVVARCGEPHTSFAGTTQYAEGL